MSAQPQIPVKMAENMVALAKEIFRRYTENLGTKPEYPTWESLPPDLAYSNIRQAMTIPQKLKLIDCYLTDDPDSEGITEFSTEEREILARYEHDLWVEEREGSGWTYYPYKDVEKQRSPYIAPWEQIPDDIKKFDYDTTDSLIELLSTVGLKVCRHKVPRFESDVKIHSDYDYPIIVSVSGHMSLSESSKINVRQCAEKLFADLRVICPNTSILLLSGLSEGTDRIVANVALDLGIDVCPVLPMNIDKYKETFAGYGYRDVEESCQDFDALLGRSLSPFILNYEDVNEVRAFRELGAYLVSNSHILIAAWDGIASDYKGGTYDTLRMAYSGVDLDLIHSTSPRKNISVDKEYHFINYLNSNEDTLIHWVKVERGEFKERYVPDPNQKILSMRNCIPDGMHISGPVFVDNLMLANDDESTLQDSSIRSIHIIQDESAYITESMPEEYISMFKKIEDFNEDIRILNYNIEEEYQKDGCGLLGSGSISSEYHSNSLLKQMACRFGIVDHLAIKFQKKSHREVALLTYITVFYTVLFNLMIMFSDTILFMLGYGVLYGLALFFSWNHQRSRNHVKSVEYRSLAETLRIEFYWSILRLSNTTSDNSYGYLKNGMSWMRAFMKGAASSFTNNYSKCANISSEESIDYVKDQWIKSQIEYGRDKSNNDLKRFDLLSDSNSVLKLAISCLTICSVTMIALIPDWSKEIILTTHDPLNSAAMDFSAYTIVKLAMIVVMNLTTILVMSMNYITNSSRVKIKARAMLYHSALSKLDTGMQTSNQKNIQKSLGIMNELGHQAIAENNDWVSESAKRDFKKQRGMMNSLNKIKGGQSKTSQFEMGIDDEMDEMGD